MLNPCLEATILVGAWPFQEADARVADDKTVLYATDENEPPLTQDNVVLLRVEKEPGNITRMLFVITRSDMVGSLAESQIIDPVKVCYCNHFIDITKNV